MHYQATAQLVAVVAAALIGVMLTPLASILMASVLTVLGCFAVDVVCMAALHGQLA